MLLGQLDVLQALGFVWLGENALRILLRGCRVHLDGDIVVVDFKTGADLRIFLEMDRGLALLAGHIVEIHAPGCQDGLS